MQETQSYNLDNNLVDSLGRWTHYQLGLSYSNNYRIVGTEEKTPDQLGFSGSINGRIGLMGYGISGSTNTTSQSQNETSFESKRSQITGRISWRYKKINFNNDVSWSQTKNNGVSNASVIDQVSASISITKNLHFRAAGKFDFNKNRSGGKFKSINSTLNWRISKKLNTNMTIDYQTDDKYRISNFLSWRRDDYNVTLGTNYSNDSRWQVSLGINFALDYDYHNQMFNLKNTYSLLLVPSTYLLL